MRSSLAVICTAALVACSDGTGPNNSGSVGLGFQMARNSVALAASTSPDDPPMVGALPIVAVTPAGMRISRDADVLIITKAQLVLRDVKLKRAAPCDDDDLLDDDDDAPNDDDNCPTVHIGPFLVNVPMDGTDGSRIVVPILTGTYSSVRFTIHKVTSSATADLAFRQAHPELDDTSIRLEGIFNGVPFVFVSDVNAKLDVPLPLPLLIGTAGGDLTVAIDFGAWFLRQEGGLYAPASANAPGNVRAKVQNNIRSAFRAFRDRNRDGRED